MSHLDENLITELPMPLHIIFGIRVGDDGENQLCLVTKAVLNDAVFQILQEALDRARLQYLEDTHPIQ